jgi:uncharacterized repeat protein (TIGR02543 family)
MLSSVARSDAAVSPPGIQWQKSLGGAISEDAQSIQQTFDGGYIVAGWSLSNDGDVTGNQGGVDYWVVKLNTSGNIQWEKSIGGSNYDEAYSIQQTSDGGYIVAGASGSNDGDINGVDHGGGDYWVAKLGADGNIQWEKSLGGSGTDSAQSIQQTSDGGYIVAGWSYSNDYEVNGGNHGASDFWVVKLNTGGAIQWQKSLGGLGYDYAHAIQQTSDGGYIVAGESNSNDGDVMGNHGGSDYWVVKLDTVGNIQWEKSLGGSGSDGAFSIQQTSDGGNVVAGYSSSNDGNVTGNHGGYDYWVVKLDTVGNIQWEKSLGGSGFDSARSIQQTSDGGYIVAGSSTSNNGDVNGNHGANDFWAVKLDAVGNIQWGKSIGGSGYENAKSIQQTSDGSYIIAGDSDSTDGDITGNHGNSDFWVVKLSWYTVTFDSQGGSSVTALTNVIDGSAIAEPTAPTRAGFVFGGWYKEAACVNAWNFATDTVTANITLYAKWTAGGSISPDVPGAVVSIDISGFPLTLAPGDSFNATLTCGTEDGSAPNPAPVFTATLEGGSASLVRVEVVSQDTAVVTALPQASVFREAPANSAIYGEARINFTAIQYVGGSTRQKSAVMPLVIADALATSLDLEPQVIDAFKDANAELASSDVTVLPGNVQPPIESLDPDWFLISSLDNTLIDVMEPIAYVLPVCFEPAGRDAANIDINVRHLVPPGKKGLLPLTYRVTARQSDLVGIFGAELAARILASPLEHLDEIFTKMVIQKEIMEGEREGWYTRLVSGILKPADAVEKGILEVAGGDALTLNLSYYVLDDAVLEAFERGGYLIVPDGLNDYEIVDPIWLNMWKPGYAPGGNTEQGSGTGSGGCAVSSGAAFIMLIVAVAALARQKISR